MTSCWNTDIWGIMRPKVLFIPSVLGGFLWHHSGAGTMGKGCLRQWQPTPVLLPGKSHGRRSLVGCSPWGRQESDRTARLPFPFSLPCTGEGNGSPPQCSCLENPRDGEPGGLPALGSQSQGRLKRLSSSSSGTM